MITVHDKHTPQDGFNNCGLAVLHPTSAYITEELNGRYDYEIEMPCLPDDDSWRYLVKYNILKSSTVRRPTSPTKRKKNNKTESAIKLSNRLFNDALLFDKFLITKYSL